MSLVDEKDIITTYADVYLTKDSVIQHRESFSNASWTEIPLKSINGLEYECVRYPILLVVGFIVGSLMIYASSRFEVGLLLWLGLTAILVFVLIFVFSQSKQFTISSSSTEIVVSDNIGVEPFVKTLRRQIYLKKKERKA